MAQETSKHLLAEIAHKALIERNGKILLCWGKAGNRWDLPGGRLHEQEDPQAALTRELKEELGIDTNIGPIIGADVWYGSRSGIPRFMVVYTATMQNEKDKMIIQEDEIEKVAWFDPHEVEHLDIWEGWKKMISNFASKN